MNCLMNKKFITSPRLHCYCHMELS